MPAKCKTLTIYSGEKNHYFLSDIIAYRQDGRQLILMIASVVGTMDEVKEAIKALGKGAPKNFAAYISPGPVKHDTAFKAVKLVRDDYEYHRKIVSLGQSTYHCLFISGSPGLILNSDDDSLWVELSGPNYTTPLLQSWIPYIKNKLSELGLLVPLASIGCKPQLLTASDSQLDDIVSNGIKYGKLELA